MPSYNESLERRVGCAQQVDVLEKRFRERLAGIFSSSALAVQLESPRGVLRQIRIFFNQEKEWRLQLFEQSRLHGSDCLTVSVLAALLASRLGHEVRIGVPSSPLKLLHAVAVYQLKGKPRSYNVSGMHVHPRFRVISPFEVGVRLAVIKPFIRASNRLRGEHKTPLHRLGAFLRRALARK